MEKKIKIIAFLNEFLDSLFTLFIPTTLSDVELLVLMKDSFDVLNERIYDDVKMSYSLDDTDKVLFSLKSKLQEKGIYCCLFPFEQIARYETIIYVFPTESVKLEDNFSISWKGYYEYITTKKIEGSNRRCVFSCIDRSIFEGTGARNRYLLENNEYDKHERVAQISENSAFKVNEYSVFDFEERTFFK